MTPPRELVFPAVPAVIAGGRILPSPSQFYLTGEDQLRITTSNSLVGVALKVQLRTARIDGTIQPQSFDHTPNTDRTVKQSDFQIGEGSVLNVTVFANQGAPLIGQTYVIVQLVRGMGAAAIVLGTILAGYVTSVQALGFPGSPIATSIEGGGYVRAISGTAPAVGSAVIETVPAGARWEFLTGQTTLITSATVSNRVVTFVTVLGGIVRSRTVNPTPQLASNGGTYITAQNVTTQADVGNSVWQTAWPTSYALLTGTQLLISAFGLQAGDQFSALEFIVREWLEVT